MGRILTLEKETYREVYDMFPEQYGVGETELENSPGKYFLRYFLDAIGDTRGTVLDAGCGGGRGSVALAEAGFDVVMTCDLFDVRGPEALRFPFREACLWHDLRHQLRIGQVDWAYSADVLEHLPTQFVGLAIDHLLRLATKGLWISVALGQDQVGVALGKALHQTVRPYRWWRETCAELGTVRDARDLHEWAVFLVEPTR